MAGKFHDACEAAVAAMLEKDRATPGFAVDRDRDRHALSIRACVPVLERMERILQDARILFKKPRVTKTNLGGSIQADNLYVTPCAQLVSGAELLDVRHRHDLDYVGGSGTWLIPRVFYGNRINLGLTFSSNRVDEILARAVLSDVRKHVDGLLDQMALHWAEAESCAPRTVAEYRARYGARDRVGFRKKMARALRECPELADEPPELVLRVMQLDHAELLALAHFAKRNQADLPVVDAEDVKAALDEMRVSGVMES